MLERACGLVVLFLVLIGSQAFAQKDSATLLGTVRDASGAVVPHAGVTAQNLSTNVAVSTTTNQQGEYLLTPLHVGEYSLNIQASGFAPSTFERIVLDVDQRLRVDAVLAVGSN